MFRKYFGNILEAIIDQYDRYDENRSRRFLQAVSTELSISAKKYGHKLNHQSITRVPTEIALPSWRKFTASCLECSEPIFIMVWGLEIKDTYLGFCSDVCKRVRSFK